MFRWPVVRAWGFGPSYGSPVSGASTPGRGRSRPRLFRRPPGRAIPDRVASWASPWVWHWWRACRQPVGPHGLMRSVAVERGGGENGWADGLTAGALRAGPDHPQKTFVERLLEPGLAASIAPRGELLWSRRPLSRTCTGRTLNGLGAQTHRQCSWRRRCCCSCHRSRCDCNGRQESPTAAAVGLPPSRSPRRRSGAVDGNRATVAPARDSTNPASIHRLRFVMDETGTACPGPSPLAGRSL